MNIRVRNVKPVGLLKKEYIEKEAKERFSLVFLCDVIKDNKKKYLLFCINDYFLDEDWPVDKLEKYSYIERRPDKFIHQIIYLERLPRTEINNNLLYTSNITLYTRLSNVIYRKNNSLTKENVLTKEEELYLINEICKCIYELDNEHREYYNKKIKKFINKKNREGKKSISRISLVKKPEKRHVYFSFHEMR